MKKVLVVRFSSIGDIILTTPVIRALATQCHCEIHVVTKASMAPVLEGSPYITAIHTIREKVSEVVDRLREEHYDFVVDLHNNLRSMQVKRALKVPHASFPKYNMEKWLYVNFRVDKLPEGHVVDRYMQAAAPLGAIYDGKGLDLFIPGSEKIDPAGYFDVQSGVFQGFTALAVGAGLKTKALEQDQLLKLLQSIDGTVILLGGPDEEALGDALAATSDRAFNMAGKLSILQSASVISQARVVISGDTGMMHVAAALDRPLITYWGSTSTVFGFAPYYADDAKSTWNIFEINDLECRPCSKMGYRKCPLGHFKCIRKLDIQAIAAAANSVEFQP